VLLSSFKIFLFQTFEWQRIMIPKKNKKNKKIDARLGYLRMISK